MWKKAVGFVAIAGVGLCVALGAGIVAHPSLQVDVSPGEPLDVDRTVAQKLAKSIRYQTVSRDGGQIDVGATEAFQAYLEEAFPLFHQNLRKTTVEGYTPVFTWEGTDSSLKPGVLLAHQDVVPVEQATLSEWTHPPFAGTIKDGFVWGRGSQDDKHNIIAQLAAVEQLLQSGFRPKRTLHFVLGQDEEVGGKGAKAAAALLTQGKPDQLAFVLDEGGAVLDEALEGLDAPAALVGIAEKGYATIELTAKAPGGHSSMPPPSTTAGRIGAAVAAIEANPMPARFSAPTSRMFDHLAPEMVFSKRLVFSNRWLFGPVIKGIMTGKDKTNATVRTTAAVTMLSGSSKDNTLPPQSSAKVNYRILPGDTVDSVVEHVRSIVGEDISVSPSSDAIQSNPSPVSNTSGPGWQSLQRSIRKVYPDAIVSPFLMVGATDARMFVGSTDHIFRFSPMHTHVDEMSRLHGKDERLAVTALEDMVRFYQHFIVDVAGDKAQD